MPHYLFKIMEGFLMLDFQRKLFAYSGFFLWVGNPVEALSALGCCSFFTWQVASRFIQGQPL
jgi:hypothetical protein